MVRILGYRVSKCGGLAFTTSLGEAPSRLDIPWALKDLQSMAGNKSMMRALYIVVDEIYLASENVEGLPDISLLRNELLKWYAEHVE